MYKSQRAHVPHTCTNVSIMLLSRARQNKACANYRGNHQRGMYTFRTRVINSCRDTYTSWQNRSPLTCSKLPLVPIVLRYLGPEYFIVLHQRSVWKLTVMQMKGWNISEPIRRMSARILLFCKFMISSRTYLIFGIENRIFPTNSRPIGLFECRTINGSKLVLYVTARFNSITSQALLHKET